MKQFYDQALQQAVVDDEANNAKAVVKTFHETVRARVGALRTGEAGGWGEAWLGLSLASAPTLGAGGTWQPRSRTVGPPISWGCGERGGSSGACGPWCGGQRGQASWGAAVSEQQS